MKVIIDTNVVLDVLVDRMPFVEDSVVIFDIAAESKIKAAITANTVADITYLMRKKIKPEVIPTMIRGILELFEVVEVNYDNCLGALDLHMADYEDAILAHCAKGWNSNYIITRNKKDFINSPVPALTPIEFIQAFEQEE